MDAYRWVNSFANCEIFQNNSCIEICKDNRTIRITRRLWEYASDVALGFDTYFAAVTPEKQGDVWVEDFTEPRVHHVVGLDLDFEFPAYPEDPGIDSYLRFYRPSVEDLVFDLGAYCGITSYVFGTMARKVIAVEPDEATAPILIRNMMRHAAGNVEIVQAAIVGAGRPGIVTFANEAATGSHISGLLGRPPMGATSSIPALRLNQLIAQFGAPRFLKIDIESAEIEVLEDSRSFLREQRPHIAIDTCHIHPTEGGFTAPHCERILRECGYEAVTDKPAPHSMMTWGIPR